MDLCASTESLSISRRYAVHQGVLGYFKIASLCLQLMTSVLGTSLCIPLLEEAASGAAAAMSSERFFRGDVPWIHGQGSSSFGEAKDLAIQWPCVLQIEPAFS